MADQCGGSITTQKVTVSSDSRQVASQLEQRRRLTVRADPGNPNYVFLTTDPGTGWREGFPLAAGDAYTFDGPGAKAALYAVSSGNDNLGLFVLTEGE